VRNWPRRSLTGYHIATIWRGFGAYKSI